MSPHRETSPELSTPFHGDPAVPGHRTGCPEGSVNCNPSSRVLSTTCVAPAGINSLDDLDPSILRPAGRSDLVSGAGEFWTILCPGPCPRSVLTFASKSKTAAAARP